MTTNSHEAITQALLEFGETIDPSEYIPALGPATFELAYHDPYAFAIATCLDRGTKSDIIWTIPYYIHQDLGHLDPFKIHQMEEEELAALFARLSKKPRYVNDAPRTIKELTTIVVEEFDGDASKLWQGQRASAVHRTFESIFGVGPGIASMAVLLIEKAFEVHFPDRWRMDIKPDVHTMRVFKRLGVIKRESESDAVKAARKLNPRFPGGLDGPLWIIGKKWCHASWPNCVNCPMADLCPRVGVKN